ncbi:hypothetical protein SAMN06265346_1091, partial [Flavobacterium hercynium]
MKYLYSLFLVMGIAFVGHAQVGIGTSVPNASAQLDVVSTDKGMLIPRVALKSTTDNTTIANGNVNGLIVFNTQTRADVVPGFYYWSANKWNKIIVSEELQNIIVPTTNNLSLSGKELISDVNGVVDNVDLTPILQAATTNRLTLNGNNLTSNVNGVTSTSTTVGTVANSLVGTNIATIVNGVIGTPVDLTPALSAATTHNLNLAGNTLTSDVNGIVRTSPTVSSVDNSLNGANLTTIVNGVTGNAVDLTPALASATTNSLTLNGKDLTSDVNGVASLVDLTPALASATTNNLTLNGKDLTSDVNGV